MYSQKTRVLTLEGQFVERPTWYFEPDRDRERVEFTLKETVPFTEIREHLIGEALQRSDGALMLSEVYTKDDGAEGEILHLFIKEFAGAVWCGDLLSYQGGINIQITYDRDRHTESLERLITFCRRRARFRIDSDGKMTPI